MYVLLIVLMELLIRLAVITSPQVAFHLAQLLPVQQYHRLKLALLVFQVHQIPTVHQPNLDIISMEPSVLCVKLVITARVVTSNH